MEKSIDFYCNFLGLKIISRQSIPKNNAEIVFLQDSQFKGCKLELTQYKSQTKFTQAEYEDRLFDHLAFEVQDIRYTVEMMRDAGIVITDEPFKLKADGAWLAFVEDPDGTLIELIQR